MATINISIELVFIILFVLMFFLWAIWYRLSTRRLRKKFKKQNLNDENKKSEGGQERRQQGIDGGEPKSENSVSSFAGSPKSSEPKLFQAADIVGTGENKISVGKNRRRSRGLIGRIRRRK